LDRVPAKFEKILEKSPTMIGQSAKFHKISNNVKISIVLGPSGANLVDLVKSVTTKPFFVARCRVGNIQVEFSEYVR